MKKILYISLFILICCYSYSLKFVLNPNYSSVLLHVGLDYKKEGKINKAMKMFKRALYYDCRNAEVYYQLGLLYKIKGNKVEEIKNYKKAVLQNFYHSDALYQKGIFYYENKNYDAALRDFNLLNRSSSARRKGSYLVKNYFYMGKIYEVREEYLKAFLSYLSFIEWGGDNSEIMSKLKDLYLKLENKERQRRLAKQLRSKGRYRMAGVLDEIIGDVD